MIVNQKNGRPDGEFEEGVDRSSLLWVSDCVYTVYLLMNSCFSGQAGESGHVACRI